LPRTTFSACTASRSAMAMEKKAVSTEKTAVTWMEFT
jgi:hypothetical protein